jgi:hypothetical protein
MIVAGTQLRHQPIGVVAQSKVARTQDGAGACRVIDTQPDLWRQFGLKPGQFAIDHQPTLMDYADMGGGLFDLAEQVAGQQDRRPRADRQFPQEMTHVGDAVGVQPVRRFVQHEHRRGTQQGAGDAEPLAHAQGIVADAPSAVARHIDDVQHAIDLSRRQAQKSPGQVQILSSRQMAIEAVRLQQGPDLAGRASAVLDDIDAANPSHAR